MIVGGPQHHGGHPNCSVHGHIYWPHKERREVESSSPLALVSGHDQRQRLVDLALQLIREALYSPITIALYERSIREFFSWAEDAGVDSFSQSAVLGYRNWLIAEGYATATVNQRLAAIRKLVRQAAARGLLDAHVVAALDQVKGPRQRGQRVGKWLSRSEAEALLREPDSETLKGKRDRAILALLIGCGLRRTEVARLTARHVQQREGRWLIVDLAGKHNRLRSVAVPRWVKEVLDEWMAEAAIADGFLFRAVNRHGKLIGDRPLTGQAILDLVATYGRRAQLEIRPHDLRRTCAKLCRGQGGDLEQIQLLLGHASIQTTERYLGSQQNLTNAPNDRIELEWRKDGA